MDEATRDIQVLGRQNDVTAASTCRLLGTTSTGRVQLGENISGRTYDVAFDEVEFTPPSA